MRNRLPRRFRSFALVTGAATAAMATALLGGCAAADDTHASLLANPTPDLLTLSRRDVDASNQIALTNDTNYRQAWEDAARMWFFDRPMRLSPTPIPH